MKLKIDNEILAQEFFEDALLLGIVAPLKDYQFTWHINQMLGLSFRMKSDMEIALTKKQRHYFFSIYQYAVPAAGLVHYLYNNQFDGEYLLPEFKHLDFLWMLKGERLPAPELKTLIQSIKLVPGVQLITQIAPEKIKHKQHLIL